MLARSAFAICALLFGGGAFAQDSGSLNQTTRRAVASFPRPPAQNPSSVTPTPRPKRTARGAETIGYTTNNVISHFLELAQLSEAAADLQAAGHTLVPVDALTAGSLAGLDRLVVGLVRDGFMLTSSQVDVIEAFVLGGGKLVFLGENSAFRANNIAVGGRFGIVYPVQGTEPTEVVLTNIHPHPVTRGAYGDVFVVDGSVNAQTGFGSMASAGPYGTGLVDFPGGNTACVVIEPGALGPDSGLVVAYSEINIFFENYLDGDNRALWLNTFDYCPTGSPGAFTWVYSTGVFGQPEGSHSLDWRVLNDTNSPQNVRVTIYQVNSGVPKFVLPPGPITLTLQPGTSFHNANGYPVGFSYEVRIEADVSQGLMMSVANWSTGTGASLIAGSQILTKDFLLFRQD